MDFYLSINKNGEFRRVYSRGKSFVSPVLVSYVMKTRGSDVRVGITTSKKIGNAVKRSRARRVIRAALRSLGGEIKPGYSFIFVARSKTAAVKSTDIRRAMLFQLKKAGALK
jgi:ribonuclease P protein component